MKFRSVYVPASEEVTLGSIIYLPGSVEGWTRGSAEVPEFRLVDDDDLPLEFAAVDAPGYNSDDWWTPETLSEEAQPEELTAEGWTRFALSSVQEQTIVRRWAWDCEVLDRQCWLSQANHIFKRLNISSNHGRYALVDSIPFALELSATISEKIRHGYLFLCAPEHLQIHGSPASLRWPEYPWFWSFDVTGADRLSASDALQLGFPSLQMETRVDTAVWNADVYKGLYKFQVAKGFDPGSQDLARHLGHS
ncbi:hypothetical protein FB45DRAFT_790696, partial [Roridomyces roridus]